MELDAKEFRATILGYFEQHGRNLPWRLPTLRLRKDGTLDPYSILVSEMMLQQTQVNRVIPKFQEFIGKFPTVQKLAEASLGDVLKVWSGLGYNRRAKFLWQTAKVIVDTFEAKVPNNFEQLKALPGIGANTAGAILVYAYNEPVLFLETNIRTVYIHHFFPEEAKVDDKQLLPLVKKTFYKENPREWCWALMDYGSYIKATHGNATRHSSLYLKQTKFVGSKRQIRGLVIRMLIAEPRTLEELADQITDNRLSEVLAELAAEGLVVRQRHSYSLA